MTSRLLGLLLATAVLSVTGASQLGAPTAAVAQSAAPPPVLAYYYIWFNPSSWNRAKTDYPVLGRYSSDERDVMRDHVRLAREAGIDGFIVSWKSTVVLNRRLERLMEIARRERFRLAVIYQGLDFERRPLPIARVAADFRHFRDRYADHPAFRLFEKPLLIWSGTWRFSREEIERAAAPVRDDMLVLATEKDPQGVERLRGAVDGDAYYWSSVNPETHPDYEDKLHAMAEAVHTDHGLWIAPAAPGFDARLVGGRTVVDRRNGETLRRQLDAARTSSPDAVGIISWNEFSENSHIEPSLRFGTQALSVVADVLGARPPELRDLDSSAPDGGSLNIGAPLIVLGMATSLIAGAVAVRRRGTSRSRT